ncbi:MAG TPA: hypothetical protein VIG99_18770 [Myxococcaceae bacterium]
MGTPPRQQGTGGTGGSSDTFAANGQPAPQYQDRQALGSTANGQNVVAGREAGDFYCEHALFSSNEFANQPGSSVARDGRGDALVTFIHHPGNLDQPNSPNRQAGAQEVVGSTLRGYVDAARGQVPGNEPIKVLVTGYGVFQGVKNNPTQDFVTHPQNLDAAMTRGFGSQLVKNADGAPNRQQLDSVNGQPVYRYQLQNQDGTTRNVDVALALLPVNDNAINGGPQSLQRLEQDFRPNAVINQGVNPSGTAWQMETRADDGGMRRLGTLSYTEGDQSRTREFEYENPSGANAFKAGQEAIERDRTAAGSVPVSQMPVARQISPQ